MIRFIDGIFFYRDLRETRQRFDSVGGEIKRKDNQIRELQQRLDVNEGCKCCILISLFSSSLNWFRGLLISG